MGSGLGLMNVGEVSDAAFFVIIESDFLLLPRVRSEYNVHLYLRFKGYPLMVTSAPREFGCTLSYREAGTVLRDQVCVGSPS